MSTISNELISNYSSALNPGHENEFIIACRAGNLSYIKVLIASGNTYALNVGLLVASGQGFIDIVQYLLEIGATDVEWGMVRACEHGHIDVVKLLISNGAKEVNRGLESACRKGWLDIIDLMIEQGANDWNSGLRMACDNGLLNIAQIMISKGANCWNDGLLLSCYSGYPSLVELMISNGATMVNEGLKLGCQIGNINIVYIMLDNGANNLNEALEYTYDIAINNVDNKYYLSMNIVYVLLSKGIDVKNLKVAFRPQDMEYMYKLEYLYSGKYQSFTNSCMTTANSVSTEYLKVKTQYDELIEINKNLEAENERLKNNMKEYVINMSQKINFASNSLLGAMNTCSAEFLLKMN